MGYYYKRKLYAGVDKSEDGMWTFGIGLYHLEDETGLYVQFYKWCITIGCVYVCEVRR